MPIFDFTCQDCGNRFDKLFRRVNGEPKATCPECASRNTRRALSLVNAGESRSAAARAGGDGGDLPFCGRCGGPGPCGAE